MNFKTQQPGRFFLLIGLTLADIFVFRVNFFFFQWFVFLGWLIFFWKGKGKENLDFLKRAIALCFFIAGLFFLLAQVIPGERFLNWGIIFILLFTIEHFRVCD